MEAYRNSG